MIFYKSESINSLGDTEGEGAIQSVLILPRNRSRMQDKYEALQTRYEKLDKMFRNLRSAYNRLRSAHNRLTIEHDNLESKHDALQRSYRALEGELEDLQSSTKLSEKKNALHYIIRKYRDQIAVLEESRNLDLEHFRRRIARFQNHILKLEEQLGKRRMKHEERISHISNMLKRFVKEDDPKSSLEFWNPKSGEEVRFVYSGKELVCLIDDDGGARPFTTEEENEAKAIFDEVESTGGGPENDGEGCIGYLTRFNVDEIDKAAKLVERIFINVFKLPESYVITSRMQNESQSHSNSL